MSFIYSDMADSMGEEFGLTYDEVSKLLDEDDLLMSRPRDESQFSVSSYSTSTSSNSSKRGRFSPEEKKERKNMRNVELRRRAKEQKEALVQQNQALSGKLNKIVLQLSNLIKEGDHTFIPLARDILQIIESDDQ